MRNRFVSECCFANKMSTDPSLWMLEDNCYSKTNTASDSCGPRNLYTGADNISRELQCYFRLLEPHLPSTRSRETQAHSGRNHINHIKLNVEQNETKRSTVLILFKSMVLNALSPIIPAKSVRGLWHFRRRKLVEEEIGRDKRT